MLRNQHPLNPIFLTVLVISLCCLGVSYFIQYTLEFEPCRLCLIQRYVYATAAALAITGWLSPYKKFSHRCLLPLFAFGTMVALYHSLTLWGLLGEAKCPSPLLQINEKLDLQAIATQPNLCAELTLLGIPLPFFCALTYTMCFRLVIKKNS